MTVFDLRKFLLTLATAPVATACPETAIVTGIETQTLSPTSLLEGDTPSLGVIQPAS